MKQHAGRRISRGLIGWAGLIIVFTLSGVVGGRSATAAPDIYPPPDQAEADVKAALLQAATNHQHIILDFGGNWCPDCRALDVYFHDATNQPLLRAAYVLVHVNVGHLDENVAIAERYHIPLKRGVPALAVLDEKGVLLYAQKTGEFEAMRHMQSSAVTDFLMKWKGA
jgi:thiol:disulfide interchange protein